MVAKLKEISSRNMLYGAFFVALLLGAYHIGNNVGYNTGYGAGYSVGYNFGFKEGESYILSVLNSRNSIMAEDLNISYNVEVKQWRDGVLILDYTTHNTVMSIGKRYLRNVLGWNNATSPMNATIYISLGQDGSITGTETKLPTEKTANGLARIAGTVSCLNTTAYQVQHTWEFTGTDTVTSTGVHWSPTSNSDNNMFAATVIATVNGLDNDQVQVTWQISAP